MVNLTRIPELAPWRPFGFGGFEERLRSLFDEFDGELFTGLPERRIWSPAVDLIERDDEIMLTAELPGMTREDVEVGVEDNVLTVSGEKAEETERKGEEEKTRFHVWERSYGKFRRSFTLPGNVDLEKIAAEFANGVLKIHMPKTAESKARHISIKTK